MVMGSALSLFAVTASAIGTFDAQARNEFGPLTDYGDSYLRIQIDSGPSGYGGHLDCVAGAAVQRAGRVFSVIATLFRASLPTHLE